MAAAHRRHTARKRWIWGAIVLLVLVVAAAGAWIGVRGIQAKNKLEAALPQVSTLKSQILARDTAGATATLHELEPEVRDAKKLTSDPVWHAAEWIPGIGDNLSAVRTLASTVDAVVNKSVAPLVGVAAEFGPASFKLSGGGIDLKPIVKAIPVFDSATAEIDAANRTIAGIDTSGTIKQVSAAQAQLHSVLAKLSKQLHQVKPLLHALPGILGHNGARNYLILFQNNGELMPRGGTIGSMALIRVDNGKIKLVKQSSASAREFPHFASPVVSIPKDVLHIYRFGLGTYVQDTTQTPRFELSYQIAKEMWKRAKGDKVDGVVAIDTVALSHILAATGPIKLSDGDTITSANAVQKILIGNYTTHTAEQVDQLNEEFATKTFAAITSGKADPTKLLAAVLQSAKEHRVLIWTSDKAEQKLIKGSEFFGGPPVSTSSTDGIGVYFADKTPSKLGYYLHEKITASQAVCSTDGKKHVRVSVALTNAAPRSAAWTLPDYVIGSGISTPRGSIKIETTSYYPHGYSVKGIQIDGQHTAGVTGTDGEYTVGQARMTMAPGQTKTLTFDLVAPKSDTRTLTIDVTPTVNPATISLGKLACTSK